MFNRQEYLIQSKPPENGVFVHHSQYTGLKNIVLGQRLQEGKPYRGVSLTTDPGRFLNPLGSIGVSLFGVSVDGFVEFPSAPLIANNLVVPCLYRTCDEELIERAKERGHQVFLIENPPPEYKFLLRYVTQNAIFVGENEWTFFGQCLDFHDYKVYVSCQFYKKFAKAVSKVWRIEQHLFRLEDYHVLERQLNLPVADDGAAEGSRLAQPA